MNATLESKLDVVNPVVIENTLDYLSLRREDDILEADYLPEPPHLFLDFIVDYFSSFKNKASEFVYQVMEYVRPVVEAFGEAYEFFSADIAELEEELADERETEATAFQRTEYLDPEEQLWDFYFRVIKQLPEEMIPNIYT